MKTIRYHFNVLRLTSLLLVFMFKTIIKKSNESDNIIELQKQIEEKIQKAREIAFQDKAEFQLANGEYEENTEEGESQPTTNILSSNCNGIDSNILQEEMEWVQEMKAQSQSTNFGESETKLCEHTVKVENKSMKNNELDMILSLQKQVEEKISQSKLIKEAELDNCEEELQLIEKNAKSVVFF